MQESFLFSYLQDGDKFAEWIMQSPQLAMSVESWLVALYQVKDAQAVINAVDLSFADKMTLLLNGRNAAQDLQAIACDGGFESIAQVFYLHYEHCCRALLFLSPSEGVA